MKTLLLLILLAGNCWGLETKGGEGVSIGNLVQTVPGKTTVHKDIYVSTVCVGYSIDWGTLQDYYNAGARIGKKGFIRVYSPNINEVHSAYFSEVNTLLNDIKDDVEKEYLRSFFSGYFQALKAREEEEKREAEAFDKIRKSLNKIKLLYDYYNGEK